MQDCLWPLLRGSNSYSHWQIIVYVSCFEMQLGSSLSSPNGEAEQIRAHVLLFSNTNSTARFHLAGFSHSPNTQGWATSAPARFRRLLEHSECRGRVTSGLKGGRAPARYLGTRTALILVSRGVPWFIFLAQSAPLPQFHS